MPDSPPSLAKQLIGTKFTTVALISTYPKGHIVLRGLLALVETIKDRLLGRERYGLSRRTCLYCNGTGYDDGYMCLHCSGSGYDDHECLDCNGTGYDDRMCLDCGGTGYDDDGYLCSYCNGTGRIKRMCLRCCGTGRI